MAGVDLGNRWVVGATLIAVWVVVSVATEAFLLNGGIREAVVRGLSGGVAFAVVYLLLRWRYGTDGR